MQPPRFTLRDVAFAADPEAAIRAQLAEVLAAARNRPGRGPSWAPGRPLKLLLAGYGGALNTGADIRTGEIVRQLRTVLGDEIELGIIALKQDVPPDAGVQHVERLDRYVTGFVSEVCDRYDGVIACEGSLFTSTFSDELTVVLTACLAHAVAQGKPAIAVGAEADRMTPGVEDFVRTQGRGVSIYCRNEASRLRLARLGLSARPGTDTGWSFAAAGTRPRELLAQRGWDGTSDVVALCPVDPFRWPLRTDPRRFLLLPRRGSPDPAHYGGFQFHRMDAEGRARFEAYLDAVAGAVLGHGRGRRIFPIAVGMEPLDRAACEGLSARLGSVPTFVAGDYDGATLVALLRAARVLVSSRLHAILLTMSAGVPAVGIGYDQRIRCLLADAGHAHLHLDAGQPDLAAALAARLQTTCAQAGVLGRGLRAFAAAQLRRQARMGRAVRADVARAYPAFPLPPAPRSWRGYLPPLADEIAALAAGGGNAAP